MNLDIIMEYVGQIKIEQTPPYVLLFDKNKEPEMYKYFILHYAVNHNIIDMATFLDYLETTNTPNSLYWIGYIFVGLSLTEHTGAYAARKLAFHYFEKSHNIHSKARMGVLLFETNGPYALKLLRYCAKRHNIFAQLHLSRYYNVRHIKLKTRLKYLRFCAKHKIGIAFNNLAVYYGEQCDTPNYKKAIKYLKLGDRHGYHLSHRQLGVMYIKTQNFDKAVKHFVKDGICSYHNLGCCYGGKFTDKIDYVKAIGYFVEYLKFKPTCTLTMSNLMHCEKQLLDKYKKKIKKSESVNAYHLFVKYKAEPGLTDKLLYLLKMEYAECLDLYLGDDCAGIILLYLL